MLVAMQFHNKVHQISWSDYDCDILSSAEHPIANILQGDESHRTARYICASAQVRVPKLQKQYETAVAQLCIET